MAFKLSENMISLVSIGFGGVCILGPMYWSSYKYQTENQICLTKMKELNQNIEDYKNLDLITLADTQKIRNNLNDFISTKEYYDFSRKSFNNSEYVEFNKNIEFINNINYKQQHLQLRKCPNISNKSVEMIRPFIYYYDWALENNRLIKKSNIENTMSKTPEYKEMNENIKKYEKSYNLVNYHYNTCCIDSIGSVYNYTTKCAEETLQLWNDSKYA